MLFYKRSSVDEIENNALFTSHISRLEQKEIERCFTRVFSTDDGQKVLAWLQVMTFQRTGNTISTEEQLRHMEGQRSLVASILRLIDRGRSN